RASLRSAAACRSRRPARRWPASAFRAPRRARPTRPARARGSTRSAPTSSSRAARPVRFDDGSAPAVMLARPPERRGEAGEPCGCDRHPRLRIVLWLLWLAVALGLALFAGHGLGQVPAPVTVDLTPKQLTPRVWYVQGDAGAVSLRNQGFMSNA